MRRRDRELDEGEALAILRAAEWGVLATVDATGWPYAVPLNHVAVEGALLLHCAPSGHKLDNLAVNARASYCAVTQAETQPLELATRYASAIVFGRVRQLTEEAEKREALRTLGLRFAPDHPEVVAREVAKGLARTAVLRLEIERISAKARR
jgi:nitroimidazol reductase NimA-like FMN-containing flavoprotein (pyridoxamine 5'-phosphate oxidase superfamily)